MPSRILLDSKLASIRVDTWVIWKTEDRKFLSGCRQCEYHNRAMHYKSGDSPQRAPIKRGRPIASPLRQAGPRV